MNVLLGTVRTNSTLRVFGCAAFVHKLKGNRRHKFEGRIEKGVYLGNEHGLQRVYLYDSRRVITTKQISFEEL